MTGEVKLPVKLVLSSFFMNALMHSTQQIWIAQVAGYVCSSATLPFTNMRASLKVMPPTV